MFLHFVQYWIDVVKSEGLLSCQAFEEREETSTHARRLAIKTRKKHNHYNNEKHILIKTVHKLAYNQPKYFQSAKIRNNLHI